MKKNVILILVFAGIVGVLGGIYYKSITKKTFSQTIIPTGIPVWIAIPAIHVSAHVETVGLDKNKSMGVPTNTNDVAWYNLGSEPGQSGNAVIDGHVDTNTGAPAVFAKLGDIKKGDTITVTETPRIQHTFKVVSIESFPTATFPVTRIFGSSSGAHLNLITCDGTWDTTTSNYTRRLVVFSQLIH